MDALKNWFTGLSTKEQRLIGSLAAVLVIFVLVKLIWQPLIDDRRFYKKNNQIAAMQLNEIRQLAGEYKARMAGGSNAPGSINQNLPQLVNSILPGFGLEIKRLQPSSSGDLQLRFENAKFNQLVAFIYALEERHNVAVKDLTVSNGSDPGLVNVTMRVYRG